MPFYFHMAWETEKSLKKQQWCKFEKFKHSLQLTSKQNGQPLKKHSNLESRWSTIASCIELIIKAESATMYRSTETREKHPRWCSVLVYSCEDDITVLLTLNKPWISEENFSHISGKWSSGEIGFTAHIFRRHLHHMYYLASSSSPQIYSSNNSW